MKLRITAPSFAIVRLVPGTAIPPWATRGEFFSITKTRDELSIVCEESQVPTEQGANQGWRALQVVGPLDFSLTGILASLATPLAAAKISIFAISTFDTDYVLVKNDDLAAAVSVLRNEGHESAPA